MRLLIVTDVWKPDCNAIVTFVDAIKEQSELRHEVMQVSLIEPSLFPKIFNTILPFGFWKKVAKTRSTHIHIMTEGILGWSMVLWCMLHKKPYTTSFFGTKTNKLINKLHNMAYCTFVTNKSAKTLLENNKVKRVKYINTGVNCTKFNPNGLKDETLSRVNKPVWLNVSTIDETKNLEEFYNLDLPGTKIQIGTGSRLDEYKEKYPEIKFIEAKNDQDLAKIYRSVDVFVCPTKTPSSGYTMLEAMASGIPVASVPTEDAKNLILSGITGAIDDDLRNACKKALMIDKEMCQLHAKRYSWKEISDQFFDNLVS